MGISSQVKTLGMSISYTFHLKVHLESFQTLSKVDLEQLDNAGLSMLQPNSAKLEGCMMFGFNAPVPTLVMQ